MKLNNLARAAVFPGVVLLAAISAGPLAGQLLPQAPAFDNSGNALLQGTYYFREAIYLVADNAGDLNRAIAIYGNITFDGNGNYTITSANINDSNSSSLQRLATAGTYSISASGYGYFTNPLSTSSNVYTVYGMVANGIFVGSTTESGFNDMFVAAPVGSPLATNSSFQGSYSVAGFLPGGTPATMAGTTFQFNPDGAGNLGTVSVKGYSGANGSNPITQSTAAVKYAFTNGAGVLTFPTSTTAPFYSGQEYLYISPDGNFIFGGSPLGYDMFVGVKNAAAGTVQNFGGLYYEAGIDEDTSQLASQGYGTLDTYYGAFSATGSATGGYVVGHERLLSLFNTGVQGFTYSTTYPGSITGSYADPTGTTQYTLGAGGAIRIASGVGPYLALSVALRAPTLSGSGVYLNPTGVTNSASSSPFTAGVSPGELITLYGTNLAAGTSVASAIPFPTTLNNVQVMVNGIAAPIYYVSPTQISVIVPYGITYSVAQIQVSNNGTLSNVVTEFVQKTTPGVFTLTANGLGYGAIEHADGTVVTQAHPALPGETVAVYMSGLGAVFPNVTEGAAGASTYTTNIIKAYVAGVSAVTPYAGLAPSLAGLYQLNVTIPATAVAGDNNLDIAGPDSYTAQAVIPVGSTNANASVVTAARGRIVPQDRRQDRPAWFAPRPAPCLVGDKACSADR